MRGKVPPVEKTWREWDKEEIGGIKILDPDGFERGDPYMNKYVYTREEFLARRARSTCRGYVNPKREDA